MTSIGYRCAHPSYVMGKARDKERPEVIYVSPSPSRMLSGLWGSPGVIVEGSPGVVVGGSPVVVVERSLGGHCGGVPQGSFWGGPQGSLWRGLLVDFCGGVPRGHRGGVPRGRCPSPPGCSPRGVHKPTRGAARPGPSALMVGVGVSAGCPPTPLWLMDPFGARSPGTEILSEVPGPVGTCRQLRATVRTSEKTV